MYKLAFIVSSRLINFLTRPTLFFILIIALLFMLAVSSKAPNPGLAKAFLLYASRPDIGLRLNLINGGVDPVRKSILTSREFKKFAPALSQVERGIVDFATPWPVIPQAPRLLASLSSLLVDALENRKSADQALKEAQRQWMQILKADPS